MTPTTPPPDRPLWLVMAHASDTLPGLPETHECYAAEIRALRDHLIQWSRLHDIDQEARNAVYRHLTAEADRAERGES